MINFSFAKIILTVFSILFLNFQALGQEAQTVASSADDRSAIRITVYTGNFAAISETRNLALGSGLTSIEFSDVSAQIEPETALLEGGNFTFIEQTFDYDLLTSANLLEKSVGKQILVERTNPKTGNISTEAATILSVDKNSAILQFEDTIEIYAMLNILSSERLVFLEIPANLRAKPTLSTLVTNAEAFEGNIILSYLTGGFTWRADYVGNLSADESSLDLQVWVTLTNTSGTDLHDVRLQLMAGDVKKLTRQQLVQLPALMTADFAFAERKQAVAPTAVSDLHLYEIPRKTDLLNNQTKQVALLAAENIAVEKFYVFDSVGQTEKFIPAKVYFEFENTKENNLGTPLPFGAFRLYTNDATGNSQFIGGVPVPNTPENERVILQPNNAFDITGMEKQTSYTRDDISKDPNQRQYEYTIGKEATFKNAKDEAVTVRFFEHFSGNWEIMKESTAHTQENARTIYWEVEVPAKGEATLSYTKRTW